MRKSRKQDVNGVNKLKSKQDRYKKLFNKQNKKSRKEKEIIVNNSMQWFFNRVRIASGLDVANKNSYRTVLDLRAGGLHQYTYHPKHSDTLPYFDKFPLIFPIELYPDGWLGLNLHYLPPSVRAIVFDDIVEAAPNKSRLMVAYAWVKAYKKHPIIKHAIKRYLITHVTSPLVSVDEDEWSNIIMMPTHTFMKKTAEEIWSSY